MRSSVQAQHYAIPLAEVSELSISTFDVELRVAGASEPTIAFNRCSGHLFEVVGESATSMAIRQKRPFWEDRATRTRPSLDWLFQRPILEIGVEGTRKLKRLSIASRGIGQIEKVRADLMEIHVSNGSIACHRVGADDMNIALDAASALLADCHVTSTMVARVQSGRLEARDMLPPLWHYRTIDASGLVKIGERRIGAHTSAGSQGGLYCEVDCKGGRVEIT